MSPRPLLIVVLAAGEGTRMKLGAAEGAAQDRRPLDAGPRARARARARAAVARGRDRTRHGGRAGRSAACRRRRPRCSCKRERRGTADAVLAAREALAQHKGDVLVLYADTPLLTADTLRRLMASLDQGAGIAVLGFEAADPTGYGRLLDRPRRLAHGHPRGEGRERERAPHPPVQLGRHGVPPRRPRSDVLGRIGNANAKGEYYLTDAVEIARKRRRARRSRRLRGGGGAGRQLARAARRGRSASSRRALRLSAMREGATLIAPETVWLAYDTKLGRDVIIEPNVFFGPGVSVEDGAEIKANCHFERARIGPGARVGPFARLRPGADLGAARARRQLRRGQERRRWATAPRPTTFPTSATATSAAGANIGAGTIFCNYDGFNKHRTDDRRGRLRRLQLLAGCAGQDRATAPTSARAASSPRTWRPARSRWSARPRRSGPAGRRSSAP